MRDMSDRLKRLARVRRVECHRAGEKAASSGELHQRLEQLAGRSRDLGLQYSARTDASDGLELLRHLRFAGNLAGVCTQSLRDAEAASATAKQDRQDLAGSKRRVELTNERIRHGKTAENRKKDARDSELARNLKSVRLTLNTSNRTHT